MADYIEPVKIAELPDKESLEESDLFIAEDNEATKQCTIEVLKEYILNQSYPVGSIYISVNDIEPGELFGGEWESVDVTFLLASGSDDIYMWKRIS